MLFVWNNWILLLSNTCMANYDKTIKALVLNRFGEVHGTLIGIATAPLRLAWKVFSRGNRFTGHWSKMIQVAAVASYSEGPAHRVGIGSLLPTCLLAASWATPLNLGSTREIVPGIGQCEDLQEPRVTPCSPVEFPLNQPIERPWKLVKTTQFG